MAVISVAAFRAREGKERELLAVIRDRLPLLRRLGFATERPPVNMRSTGGVVIHISEWTSEEAIEAAHHHEEVLGLWRRFDACSEYVPLYTLDEVHEPFATFRALPGE